METHSSILAWRIPRTGEPGGQQFIGSERIRHDRSALAYTHTLCKPSVEALQVLLAGVSAGPGTRRTHRARRVPRPQVRRPPASALQPTEAAAGGRGRDGNPYKERKGERHGRSRQHWRSKARGEQRGPASQQSGG